MKIQLFTALTAVLLAGSAAATSLNDAVSMALNTNPEVMADRANQLEAEHRIREAKGGKLPTVTLDAATGWEHSNNSTTRADNDGDAHRDLWRNEAALRLRQNIFNGGLTKNNVRQQQSRLDSVTDALNETRDNIALHAVEAYLNIIRTSEKVRLAEENLAVQKEYVDMIAQRAEAGRGNRADVRQAEGRYSLAQANVMAAQRDQQDAEAYYYAIMGTMPAGTLSKPVAPHDQIPTSFDAALQIAMTSNPAVQSDMADIDGARYAVKAANSMYFPKIDLEMNAVNGHQLDGVYGINNEYSALVRLTKNLYTGGSETANKRALEAREGAAQAQLGATKREVELNLRQAWHSLQTARLRLVPLTQYAVSAEETRDAYRSQFDIGQRTLLDLLDAEIELFNTRNAVIDEHFTHDVAAYGVLAATGQLANSFSGQSVAWNN